MKKKKPTAASVVDGLFALGAALIAIGVGLWSVPGGLVTAGVFCLLGSILIDRAPEAGQTKDGDAP